MSNWPVARPCQPFGMPSGSAFSAAIGSVEAGCSQFDVAAGEGQVEVSRDRTIHARELRVTGNAAGEQPGRRDLPFGIANRSTAPR